jgi:tyrosinase
MASTGAQAVRVRRDVRSLAVWDPTILWYARAVRHLQARPVSEPTSWTYLAAVHGRFPSGQKPRFWDQCQHQTWYFLPWHRGYLWWFEQIVRAAIAELNGPHATWALPYWNYSHEGRANARTIPQAFREPHLPDGSHNPLHVANRNPAINQGKQSAIPVADVSVAALDLHRFAADPHGGSGGFGGPATGFNHDGGTFGELEAVPHGVVHVDVGGLMGDLDTAALDPIFWLHHANIDRLWAIWVTTKHQANPTAANWRNLSFTLHDAAGGVVNFTPAQMLDTTAAPLGYRYDSLVDPRDTGPVPPLAPATMEPVGDEPPPEMVGASTGAIRLGRDDASTAFAVEAPHGAAGAVGGAPPGRLFLNVENVVGATTATNYDVYLNLPAGADDEQRQEHHAGVLSTFGIRQASDPDRAHGGSGLSASFDVTDLAGRLQARELWDPTSLHVTFSPRPVDAEIPTVTVGRVSLYAGT